LHLHCLADGGCLVRAGDTQIVLTSAEVEKLRRIVNSAPVPAEAEGAPV
jgi:hypothetical protein